MGLVLSRASIEAKIRRLSLNQLKALLLLCRQKKGLTSSTGLGDKLGIRGKSLGGLFSSLSRQKIVGRPLVIPFGRELGGRGLFWRVNPDLGDQERLTQLIESILKLWER